MRIDTWKVSVVLPKIVGVLDRAWAKNLRCTVIAESASEAIATVLIRYPDAEVFSVQHNGENDLLVQKGVVIG